MDSNNPYAMHGQRTMAAMAAESERTAFIRRTYTHLVGAIFAFVGLEALLLSVIPPQQILGLFAGSQYTWLIVLGAFMGVSYLANYWARSDISPAMQYAGLGLYVVAEAVIFLPLMCLAIIIGNQTGTDIVLASGLTTLVVFGGLTGMVFMTNANLSWMGRYLTLAGFGAMAAILVSILCGFSLGVFFAAAMVVLAAGYILYETSNVLHNYNTHQHVAASLALFASVALMLWYVMQIFLSMASND